MQQKICRLWTNFAKYQNPTPEHEKLIPVKWTPVEAVTEEVNLDYLLINDDMKMARNINKHRVDFWKKIYGKWNKSFLTPKL